MKKHLAVALAMFAVATAQATLLGRDINGHAVTARDASGVLDPSAVFLYDTVLNITWLRDANANGGMNWYNANAWANSLNIGGFTGWRLPKVTDSAQIDYTYSFTGGTDRGYNVRTTGTPSGGTVYSEMASLYYDTLGNKASQTCVGLINTGDFQNLIPANYWSSFAGSPVGLGGPYAWMFITGCGVQDLKTQSGGNAEFVSAFAVRPGDVLTAAPPGTGDVPIPAWALVLLAGGLIEAARRRKAA
jgi:hypothetical protein